MSDSFCYCLTDHKTKKIYIGSHKGSKDDGYLCSSKYVLKEHTLRPTDFTRQIIAEGDWTTIRKFEDRLIRALWAANIPCYNKATGGLFKFDTDVRRNMSLASKGRPKSEETKAKMKIANQLKAKNPAVLEKLRRPKPAGFGKKVSASLKGRKRSAEHCAALSKALKGKKGHTCSEEHKAMLSQLFKGRPSPNAGKTYEELYGIEKANELKRLRSISVKRYLSGRETIITCPHCGYQNLSAANMSRWHLDNCKRKTK